MMHVVWVCFLVELAIHPVGLVHRACEDFLHAPPRVLSCCVDPDAPLSLSFASDKALLVAPSTISLQNRSSCWVGGLSLVGCDCMYSE